MGATKKEYQEIVTAEFEREAFEQLCIENDLKVNIDYHIKSINVPSYPYHESEKWNEQKIKANKEYKKLKQIEYEIINL